MDVKLKAHHSCKELGHEVWSHIQQKKNVVEITFEVEKKRASDWKTNPRFGKDYRKNWELWNFDVVEAFLQLRPIQNAQEMPYLEVQLSPLGQPLCLVIEKPRVSFYTPLFLQTQFESQFTSTLWKAKIHITLPDLLPRGDLHGGLFACLGEGEREFWSANPNHDERPDFHRPELFIPLGSY